MSDRNGALIFKLAELAISGAILIITFLTYRKP